MTFRGFSYQLPKDIRTSPTDIVSPKYLQFQRINIFGCFGKNPFKYYGVLLSCLGLNIPVDVYNLSHPEEGFHVFLSHENLNQQLKMGQQLPSAFTSHKHYVLQHNTTYVNTFNATNEISLRNTFVFPTHLRHVTTKIKLISFRLLID
jgi:hypothetical protein